MKFHPLTPDRWNDFEALLGPQGGFWGCWCLYWRLKRKEMEALGAKGRRKAMRELVESGCVPGILGYARGQPVGWCSIAPREEFGALNRSRILKPIDERPVWSLVCMYAAKELRGKGAAQELIAGACAHAKRNGAEVVEAYPPCKKAAESGGKSNPVAAYMGFPTTFAQSGFRECARPSAHRVIMRKELR